MQATNYIQLKKPPIDHALPNTPIYNMIRFWGRKPYNLVRRYIEHYTTEGDVVLDPFAGCGVVATEGLKARRRVIYNDLNAYCRFIAKVSSQPLEIDKLRDGFNGLLQNIHAKTHPVSVDGGRRKISFDWLYSTKCSRCSGPAEIIAVTYTKIYEPMRGLRVKFLPLKEKKRVGIPHELLKEKGKLASIAIEVLRAIQTHGPISHQDLTKKLKLDVRPEEITRAINEKLGGEGFIKVAGETPILIEYECHNQNCKVKRGNKSPDKDDLAKMEQINQTKPVYYYPTDKLSYPSSNRFLTLRPGTESVDRLFTRRNLIALSIIKHEIDELDVGNEIKEALLLCFIAILEHVCKMERPNKKGWGVKNYIIHPIYLEQNVLHALNNRFGSILAAKEEVNKGIGNFYKESSSNSREVVNKEANICLLNLDSRNLPIEDSCIDYVFTDPEYGDAIQYYELSLMGSAWLNLKNDWKDEIVVNSKQGKTPEIYRDMLCQAFREIYRVLKPNKYMTVTFHSREIKYWNALMYAIQIAGFKYVTAVYQIPQKEYTNWLYARNPGEMNGDVYVTFYKPEVKPLSEAGDIDVKSVAQNIIVPEAQKIILLHNGQATFNQLIRGITLCLISRGLMHNPKIRDVNYESIFDSHFQRLGRSKIWRLKREERVSPVDFIPLDRRIVWIIYSIFNRKYYEKGELVPISDILSAIFTTLKNAKTPENKEILDLLRQVAEPRRERGVPFWKPKEAVQMTLKFIPPEFAAKKIEVFEKLDHDRIIKVISQLGCSFGFDVWIGDPEVRKDPELKKYRTVIKLEIPFIDKPTLNRLKNVDVIWLQQQRVPRGLIEVEHTTDLRGGLLRMANIFEVASSYLKVNAFTILPDKKVAKLGNVVREPSIKSLIGKERIYYATYSLIAELADQAEYKTLRLQDFMNMCEVLEPQFNA